MDKILHEATQLLNECKPKEALEKLSGLQKKSEQSLQLTENCKMLLRQQLLYLLKEANNSNDYEEMEVYISEYKRFLGMDEYCKVYDDRVATLHKNLLAQEVMQRRFDLKKQEKEKQEKREATFGCIIMVLLFPLFIIILLFLAETFL